MKVTPQQKIDALIKAMSRLAYYRTHDNCCEIEHTEFCTCGMRQAIDAAHQAATLEVEG